jgi:hypothetical protein
VNGSGSFAFVVRVSEAGRAAHVAALAMLEVALDEGPGMDEMVALEMGLDEVVLVDVTKVVRVLEDAAVPTRHCE